MSKTKINAQTKTDPQTEVAQHAEISLICDIVVRIAERLQRLLQLNHKPISLAIFMLAFPAFLLTLPVTLGTDQNTVSLSPAARAIVSLWPFLLVLAPTSFAWHTTGHIIQINSLLKALAADCESKSVEGWRSVYSRHQQIIVSVLIGIVGALAAISMAVIANIHPLISISGTLEIFVWGFLGGLGYYVGLLAPFLLMHVIKHCYLQLDPLDPVGTIDLRKIATHYSQIVLKGAIVGFLLSTPLLIFFTFYVQISVPLMFLITVAPGWIILMGGLILVQIWLYKATTETRDRTRKEIRSQINKIYGQISQVSSEDREKLNHLIELDQYVGSRRILVVDFFSIIRALLSMAITAVPVLIKIIM